MATLRVPPGRAGRLWLRHRLDIAERGSDLLERKLRAMRGELQRLRELSIAAEQEWRERTLAAETWLLRADLIGGAHSADLVVDDTEAQVTITWATTMGVRYPSDGTCVIPLSAPSYLGSSALVQAREAYRLAAVAAVREAAAREAVARLSAEVSATSQRVRALRRRWIPLLREALTRAEFELEELERSEAVRRLRASAT